MMCRGYCLLAALSFSPVHPTHSNTSHYQVHCSGITRCWGLCRKALRAQAQALAEQPFSREAYARDPKQARARRSHVLLSC